MRWELMASIQEQVEGVNNGENLGTDVGNIINTILLLVGILAVVVIIIGGVFYITSQGDPEKVKRGKEAVMGGIIGLIITIMAFAIVQFVITSMKH